MPHIIHSDACSNSYPKCYNPMPPTISVLVLCYLSYTAAAVVSYIVMMITLLKMSDMWLWDDMLPKVSVVAVLFSQGWGTFESKWSIEMCLQMGSGIACYRCQLSPLTTSFYLIPLPPIIKLNWLPSMAD